MAADTIISNAAAIAACNAIVDLLDVGGGGSIKIYSVGSGVPADADAAITDQTLLAVLPLSATAFGNAVDDTGKATATANSITADADATASGDAAFYRSCNAAGTAVIQGTAGAADADMILNSATIVENTEVSVSAWTFSVPEQA